MFHGLFGVPLMFADEVRSFGEETACNSGIIVSLICIGRVSVLRGWIEVSKRYQERHHFFQISSIFLWSISTLTKSIQLWNDVDQCRWILIYIYIYTTYSLCSRASLKLGTPADSRKCQPRGLDVSTNPRYVLENVNIFRRADRTGLDIESHTFDTHKP